MHLHVHGRGEMVDSALSLTLKGVHNLKASGPKDPIIGFLGYFEAKGSGSGFRV